MIAKLTEYFVIVRPFLNLKIFNWKILRPFDWVSWFACLFFVFFSPTILQCVEFDGRIEDKREDKFISVKKKRETSVGICSYFIPVSFGYV